LQPFNQIGCNSQDGRSRWQGVTHMARKFKTVDYEQSGQQTLTIDDCLPADHLARFIVGIVAMLDLSAFYARYAAVGGEPIDPKVLLALLLYAYATGMFSSRKIEKATYEVIPFRFIAGGLHPDHDTIANFRKVFLVEIKEVFAQVLLVAQEMGYLSLPALAVRPGGNISLDGSKIHADASKSHAVSYGRLLKLEEQLRQEVDELLALGEQVDQAELPPGLDIDTEVAFRQERLPCLVRQDRVNLAEAKRVLEARAEERYQVELADYQAKLQAREEKAQETGRKPGGPAPKPPTPGPRDTDQYNFTDPGSRIMKNSKDGGFDQHYNVQVAVDQKSMLAVGSTLSNHPVDTYEAIPTLDAIPPRIGQPKAAALDNGYFAPQNIKDFEARGVDPFIATGREPHHKSWQERFAETPEPPPAEASPIVKMAYKLQTEIGKAIYGLRKSTVEPVIGIIKEVLGFRQPA
jgi:transposase